MTKKTKPGGSPPGIREVDQFDKRFHPWPGWPNNMQWCSRCTFEASDDYERLAEKLVEQMHLYAMHTHTEPHQVGQGYNNLVRMAAHALRAVGREGVRAVLSKAGTHEN